MDVRDCNWPYWSTRHPPIPSASNPSQVGTLFSHHWIRDQSECLYVYYRSWRYISLNMESKGWQSLVTFNCSMLHIKYLPLGLAESNAQHQPGSFCLCVCITSCSTSFEFVNLESCQSDLEPPHFKGCGLRCRLLAMHLGRVVTTVNSTNVSGYQPQFKKYHLHVQPSYHRWSACKNVGDSSGAHMRDVWSGRSNNLELFYSESFDRWICLAEAGPMWFSRSWRGNAQSRCWSITKDSTSFSRVGNGPELSWQFLAEA